MMRIAERRISVLIFTIFFLFSLLLEKHSTAEAQAAVSKIIEKAIKESGGTVLVSKNRAQVSLVYQVARKWHEDEETRDDAIEVFHYLSDVHNDVLSSVKLGLYYANQKGDDGGKIEQQKAVKYLSRAGENGPHHQSLYNAGRILAEEGDWVGSLAHLKAAATLPESHDAKFVNEDTLKFATDAYELVSRQISHEEITAVEIADIFLYGSLVDLAPDAEKLWTKAVTTGLVKVNPPPPSTKAIHYSNEDDDSNNSNNSATLVEMMETAQTLRSLWEKYRDSFSDLQSYLLLANINNLLRALTRVDTEFVPMAAGYAEAFAFTSVFCYTQPCFEGAAINALSYYQQINDQQSVQRVLELLKSHPQGREVARIWNSKGGDEL